MVVDRSNVDHITRGLQSTEGVRLHNHRKKLRQRFDIIKKLGQGTYGKVQLGINKETGQEVAIKTIKKCKIETDADLVRIRREIQIMSSVRHPNIIHIYEVFENREKIVLVMEYAAGGELYDYLSERKVLEEAEARRIFRQISTAIYYCHKHKICHRDLKLENILLDEHGSAKIADFGLSNVFDGTRLLSTYCGSPLYASPEIVKGTPYHGPEVDCWSLGVLLYTLVYGAMPFDGTNFKRLVKHISQGDYFEPKKVSPASPLIRDMLTVNSSDRATIEKICSHWWVNQGFNVSCLDIAEDLANQTPVRLDLLLSLAPPPENSEKIVVTDEQRTLPPEGPPRSMSVGSFMDLDGGNAEERVKSFVAREMPSEQQINEKTMKRKLQPVPSKSFSGARKKERMKPEGEEEEDEKLTETSKKELIEDLIDDSAKKINGNSMGMDIDTDAAKLTEPSKSEEEKCKSLPTKSEEAEKIETIVLNQKYEPEKEPSDAMTKDKSSRKSVKVIKKKVPEKKESEPKIKDADLSVDDKAKIKKKKTESPTVEDEHMLEIEKVTEKAPVKKELNEKTEISNSEKLNDQGVSEKQKPSKVEAPSLKTVSERRKSKVFETAEKFMGSDQKSPTQEKSKKVFIPGVKVSDFAKAFERRSSIPTPTLAHKSSPPKKIIPKDSSLSDRKTDPAKPTENKGALSDLKRQEEKPSKNQTLASKWQKDKSSPDVSKSEEKIQPPDAPDDKQKNLKDSARNAIMNAINEGEKKELKKQILKPPVPITKAEDLENRKKGLTLQIGKETATVQVHTPEQTKFFFEPQSDNLISENKENVEEKPKEKKTSKLEITIKSSTLPRRASKPEMRFGTHLNKELKNFRTEIEHRVGDPSHIYTTQRSEVAFPVSAAPKPIRSMSLEPEGRTKRIPVERQSTKERIIPIEYEGNDSKEETEARDRVKDLERAQEGIKKQQPYQRTWSLKSNSLSRQSTQDSDTESIVGSTAGEAIKKSPREFIIPIAMEGGGYVTPRATSLEPAENIPSKKSHRPFSKKFSLWSDNGSEDESPFSTLQRHSSRDFDEPFRLHRLRSTKPTRTAAEKTDSGSGSEEEEDDDGFELLTAENLFSTLLSRVRSLTQRLNVEDGLRPGFPSSRLFSSRFGPSERLFPSFHQPLTRLFDKSDFGRSLSQSSGNNGPGGELNRDAEDGDFERLGRSHSRGGDSRSKRSDSDTSSLSESLSFNRLGKGKSTEEKEKKRIHHHQHRHHSRTRSMPSCPAGSSIDKIYDVEGGRQNRMWTGKTYEKIGAEGGTAPSVRYRTEIPKLIRPTSLLLEREQNSMEKIEGDCEILDSKTGKQKEKDFYDILAEKYGITKVKRYDLPREKRNNRGYREENSRADLMESREKRERSEESEKEEQKRSDNQLQNQKAESLEGYIAPSEKLAAVLNHLESRNEKGSNTATAIEESKFKTDEEKNGRSRTLKKVIRHSSDLTLKEYNGFKERGKKGDKLHKESSPEGSVHNKYVRYLSLDEGGRSEKKEEEKPKKKYVDNAIRSLRKNIIGLQDVSSENVLIKRAVSLSDCANCMNFPGAKINRSTVNSVVGMFNKLESSAESKKKEKMDGGGEKSKIPTLYKKANIILPKIELAAAGKDQAEALNSHSFHERRIPFDHQLGKDNTTFNFEDPNNYLSPDSESLDSWSFCSDLGATDDVILKNYSNRHGNADDLLKESVSERIRRKSFYTRFNDWKKPRRSLILSRSYEPEGDINLRGGRPTYSRSVSSGDDPRPRPFYKSQMSESQPSHNKDTYDWTRNRALSPSCLRSGNDLPSSYATVNLPREGGRSYRSMSVYSQRPFGFLRPRSPSLRGESPTDYLE